MPNSFKIRLKNLPISQKAIFLGSFVMIISVFLPWYSDIDRFKTGDIFLGITGPVYLAGLIVLIAAVFSFGLIMMNLLEKPAPKLPMSESHSHIFVGALSVLMLILANSVYFHTKFGINITDKNVGIGTILAFVGTGFVILGSFMANRKKAVNFEGKGHIEPLINMDSTKERVQGTLDNEPVREPFTGVNGSAHEEEKKSGVDAIQGSLPNLNDKYND